MSVVDRLFAGRYPWLAGLSEKAGQAGMRAGILACAFGRTLEIGAVQPAALHPFG